MKGTWPRGLDSAEDALAALALHHDEKNRSEHIMIVDLLRNDLGRICATGSIRVDGLFRVEHYPTLLQMTSTVSRHSAPRRRLARDLPQPLPQRLHHRRAQDQHHAHHSRDGRCAARHLHRGHRLHRAHRRRLLQRRHPNAVAGERRGNHGRGRRHRLRLGPSSRVRRVPPEGRVPHPLAARLRPDRDTALARRLYAAAAAPRPPAPLLRVLRPPVRRRRDRIAPARAGRNLRPAQPPSRAPHPRPARPDRADQRANPAKPH